MQAYESLAALFGRLRALNDATGILGWDAQTLMPAGAADGRAEQLATLRGMAHELLVAPSTADLLAKAQADHESDADDGLGPWRRPTCAR